jgi:hypothetical protein
MALNVVLVGQGNSRGGGINVTNVLDGHVRHFKQRCQDCRSALAGADNCDNFCFHSAVNLLVFRR